MFRKGVNQADLGTIRGCIQPAAGSVHPRIATWKAPFGLPIPLTLIILIGMLEGGGRGGNGGNGVAFQRVPAGSSRFQRVPAGSSGFQRVPTGSSGFQWEIDDGLNRMLTPRWNHLHCIALHAEQPSATRTLT